MTDMVLPQFGMGMADGTIIAWHKAMGDTVVRGEPLCDVEAAKTTVEVVAPCDGILQQILVPAGSKTPVNTVIAIIGDEAAVAAPSAASRPTSTPPAVMPAPGKPDVARPAPDRPGSGLQIEPRARRAARTRGVDLGTISGTGPGGRIIEEDVIRSDRAAAALASAPAPVRPPSPATHGALYHLRMRCDARPLVTLLDQLSAQIGQPVPIEAALLRATALAASGTVFAGNGIGLRSDDGAISAVAAPSSISLLAVVGAMGPIKATLPALVIEWHVEERLDEVVRAGDGNPASLSFSASDSAQWQITMTICDQGANLADAKRLLAALRDLFDRPLAILA